MDSHLKIMESTTVTFDLVLAYRKNYENPFFPVINFVILSCFSIYLLSESRYTYLSLNIFFIIEILLPE